MAITNSRPPIKETVGAQYICFATATEDGAFDSTYETAVEKSEVVKSVSITENGDTTNVYGSGKIYDTEGTISSYEISTEVVAYSDAIIHKMKGDTIDKGGLILAGANGDKPYFAYGKVVKLAGGKFRYDWYPKCKLTSKTDDIATSEDSFSEQNDTLTITAYPFDNAGNITTKVSSELNLPEGLTEEKFFSKPILTPADLASVLTAE